MPPQGFIDEPLGQGFQDEPSAKTPPAPEPNSFGTFASHVWTQLDPSSLMQAIRHPIDTAKGIGAAHEAVFRKAQESYQKGDTLTAARHFVDYLVPFIGPVMDQAADRAQQGQYAASVGDAVGLGLGLFGPKALAENVPTLRSSIADRLAQKAQTAATDKAVNVMTPKVGPNKIRFGNMAETVAPDVLRQTASVTKGGLSNEIGMKLDTAHAALDAAYDAIPNTKMYPTSAIVKAIDRAIAKQQVSGIGGSVSPATRADRIAALTQAKQEVQALGSLANADNLRALKGAWGEGAKQAFTPAIAADAFKLKNAGAGWADANAALTEYLVSQHNELKGLNADVSLWRKASDVMQAAEEAERVRPEVMRTILARGAGAAVGGSRAGAEGAAVGALIGPLVEKAINATGPARKLMIARALQNLADGLGSGSKAKIQQAVSLLRPLTANVLVRPGVAQTPSSAGAQ